MTLAEEYFKKATEETNYDLDQEILEKIWEDRSNLQRKLAWEEYGSNWKTIEHRITDAYKTTKLTERILQFKDYSFLKVLIWSDSYGNGDIGDIEFYLVRPYEKMITVYEEI